MKVLYPDRTLYIMAESEVSNYPAENALDNYPKHYWKAATTSGWLRLHVDSKASGVAISNVNANQIDITIKDIVFGTATSTSAGKLIDSGAVFVSGGRVAIGQFVWNHTKQAHTTITSVDSDSQLTLAADIMTAGDEYSIEVGDLVAKQTWDLGGIDTYYALLTDSGLASIRLSLGYSLGYEYGYQYYKHNILIELTGSSAVYCGVARAGEINTFPDPQYGISEGLKDYSIVKELNNGSLYVKRRNIVKTFNGKLLVERDRVFYEFMREIMQLNGPVPLFWWVSSNLTNLDWVVFAKYDAPPSGSHAYYQHSEIDFSLLEVV